MRLISLEQYAREVADGSNQRMFYEAVMHQLLTDWYPPEVEPVRPGYYITCGTWAGQSFLDWKYAHFLYWTGKDWRYDPDDKHTFNHEKTVWRGLRWRLQ